jgi:pantoate--beta-alanine ligase
MKTVSSIDEFRIIRAKLPGPVGLVPTMGYLHAGHISLAEWAGSECASTIVSVFVNPTQFSPAEDLAKYPRDLPRDITLLESAGVDLVWTPTPGIMYPTGYQTWVSVHDLSKYLEGAQRPEHFRGVTTVVAKLFNVVQPQKAYFGQKDAQQAAVIRRMTLDLNFPVEIIICPTIRELDGLAMSSRNTYLNPDERKAAVVLYRALSTARAAYLEGERGAEKLRSTMRSTIQSEPLAQLQYVSCADFDTLQELERITGRALLSLAVFIGKTRLIDNFILE